MNEYQRITLKETGEEFVVDMVAHATQHAGFVYLTFIVYDEFTLEKKKFLTVMPQDILKRQANWNQEEEDIMVSASAAAEARESAAQDMYQTAAAEELHRRAEANMPPREEGGDADGLFG